MLKQSIGELINSFAQTGELVWIGVRPERGAPMQQVDEVMVNQRHGLIGDRYQGSSGKRQVTLMQWEHLAVLESLTGLTVTPDMLRRNLVIKGINLLALKNQHFYIGAALFKYTGLCQPCSRMETILGHGGYNAMRGHGGLTAQVLQGGLMRVGDQLSVVVQQSTDVAVSH
ncbi:MAG: MOSC domain-containing protein [Methylococcales bacterium]